MLQQQQQDQQRYRIIIEQTGSIVFEWDPTSNYFFSSKGYEKFEMYKCFGIHAKNINGTDVCYADDIPILMGLKEKLYSGATHAEVDLRLKKTNGDYPWCRLSTTIVRDPETNSPKRIIGTIKEIDIAKKADIQLRHTTKQLEETTKELNHLLNNLPVGVGIYELGYPITRRYVNDSVCEMCGIDPENLTVCLPFSNISRESIKQMRIDIEHGKNYYGTVYHHIYGNNDRWIRCFSNILIAEGNIPVCYCVMADVTEQIKIQQSYNQQHKLYHMLLEESPMVMFDYNIKEDSFSFSTKNSVGKRTEYVCEHYLDTLTKKRSVHCDDILKWVAILKKPESIKPESQETELRLNLFGSGYRWHRISIANINDETGNASHVVGMGRDIQHEKDVQRSQKALKMKAETDFLSGLYNRAAMEERSKELFSNNDNFFLKHAFMLFDIDNFKSVNDTYGHINGDRLIRKIGDIFRNTFRTNDIIGRIGGDEFAVLMCDVESTTVMCHKAASVLDSVQMIASEFQWDIPISVSIGISYISSENKNADFQTIYEQADQALYRAKEAGKNRFVLYKSS